MQHDAVFFSNNKKLTLMNTDVRRIVSMIKLLSDLPQFIRKKDAFRCKGMDMNILPIIFLPT